VVVNTLFLVRHGENLANLTREFSHRIVDYPLTLRGRLQARQVAAHLARFPLQAVYSSPLRRAIETARAIALRHNLAVKICDHFREVNVGELEVQPPSQENWALHDRIFAEWYRGNAAATFPGGEDYQRLWQRLQEGLRLVVGQRAGQTIAIVGHGGLFNATIKGLCPQTDIRWIAQNPMPNGAISEIELHSHNGRLIGHLRRWADASHLRGPWPGLRWPPVHRVQRREGAGLNSQPKGGTP
jgi:broad specificity phosphatase PhoE